MKCIHCQGTMRKGRVPFDIDRKGYHLRLERIPAWVCSQCGETYFGEKEIGTIQKVIKSVDKQTKRILAPA